MSVIYVQRSRAWYLRPRNYAFCRWAKRCLRQLARARAACGAASNIRRGFHSPKERQAFEVEMQLLKARSRTISLL